MTVITGKCKWASISAPNTTYEPAWQIDVSLDDENLKKVKADGLSIKNKGDDRGNFVTIKRKVEGKKGISADLLKVQILDLVPYSNDGDEDFDVVDSGYQSDDDIPFAS